jgi:hypothetical protein
VTYSPLPPAGPGLPFRSGDRGRGSGLVDRVAFVLTALIGAIFFVGALVVITAVFLAVVLVAICVVAVRGAVHALVPRSRDHRVDQGGFRPSTVIDATAKVLRSTVPKTRR